MTNPFEATPDSHARASAAESELRFWIDQIQQRRTEILADPTPYRLSVLADFMEAAAAAGHRLIDNLPDGPIKAGLIQRVAFMDQAVIDSRRRPSTSH